MSRFTASSIDQVREAVDFAEIVSAYTELRRAGTRMLGLCPFHDERTPSFSVDPREKLYYCFGCEAHGDVFTFIQEKQGVGFAEAVETLAERYGVELERQAEDPRAEATRKRMGRLGELLDRTGNFFMNSLWVGDEAADAREYLAGRGLGEPVLRKFGVGYSPKAWNTVVKRGRLAGYTDEEMMEAGLVQRSQKSDGVYDRFRGRITFPIRDSRGRTRGFGGRAMDPGEKAKYVNSPEGPMYHKKEMLYGIDLARTSIIKAARAVIVEGYTDVIAVHQAGIENVVAISGTAFTTQQARELAAMCDELVLCLDADRAGREAMLRSQQQLPDNKRVRLRVAAMPPGKDPADLLAGARPGHDAAEQFKQLVEDARELVEFHVTVLLDEADLGSAIGRDQALDSVVPVLAGMGDSILRSELVREVSDRLDIDPAMVNRRLAAPAAKRYEPDRGAAPAKPERRPGGVMAMNRSEQIEFGLLAMCIAAPSDGHGYLERLGDDLLTSPLAQRARDHLTENLDQPMQGIDRQDEEFNSFMTQLVMRAGSGPATREAMELNILLLEEASLARRLEAADATGSDAPVLQKQLGEMRDRIQHMR